MPPAGPESEPDPPELGSSPGRRDLSMKAWENLGVGEPHEDVGQAGVIVSVVYISSAERMPEIVRMWRAIKRCAEPQEAPKAQQK